MTLAEEIKKHFWWHTIDLGGGVVTPGRKTADIMQREAAALFEGVDLQGKTFLDVGAWNGGFSVEARRRGAKRIVGLDHYTWNHPLFRGRETFDLVSKAFGDRFEAVDIDLDSPRLSLESLGQFDVVLYAGVFYHLVDPIAASREVAARASELLILETHIEEIETGGRPAMLFYPGAELNGDASNWWGPNVECVVELLKLFGFPHVAVRAGSADNRRVFHARRRPRT